MQRFRRMDGLRGALAVYVMLAHALPFTNLPPWFCGLFHHGEAAVDLFFCLSGLVITQSLTRAGGRFWPFIRARLLRLMPVYIVALALSTALLPGNPAAGMPWAAPSDDVFWSPGLPSFFIWHLGLHLLLLQGVLPACVLPFAWESLLTPAWSLSTEWQFYLLLGLVAPRRMAPLCLGLLTLGMADHLIILPPCWQFSRAFLPDAAPYFALGLASIGILHGPGAARRVDYALFLVCLVCACMIGWHTALNKALPPLVWALILAVQRHPAGAVLETRPLLALGAISYPLYLIHEPLQRALAMLIAPIAAGRAGVFTLLWLPLALIIPILAAVTLHYSVERRFMQRRGLPATPPAT
ncbi:MAG: acyltransferase [Acidocella sp.]|nr:acyltransferase [Acidocella sp.]